MIPVAVVVFSYVMGLMTYHDALDECQKTDDPVQCVVQIHTSEYYEGGDE